LYKLKGGVPQGVSIVERNGREIFWRADRENWGKNDKRKEAKLKK